MSDEAAEKTGAAASPENKAPAAKVGKVVRRAAAGSGTRRPAASADPKPAGAPAAPVKADPMKLVAMGVCVALFVGCLGVGVYILFVKKGPGPKVTKLSEDAQKLADKAERAGKLYDEGKANSGSSKLEELVESEKKLFEALNLFNEVADEYKTVPGHEDAIRKAHDKKLFIDAELKKVRDKKTELEMQADRERREKAKPSQPVKPPDATPETRFGKEPTEEELGDKNLDRLFENDPSEYERLAKIREKKDPNFKMKKP